MPLGACDVSLHTCKAQVSMMQRVQSNPFVAGNLTVAPKDRQGEGAEPAVTVDDTPLLAPPTQPRA